MNQPPPITAMPYNQLKARKGEGEFFLIINKIK